MHKYLTIIMLAVFLIGCTDKKEVEKLTPLAEVNSDILYLEDFRSTFSEEQWKNLTQEQRRKEIEDWANVTLLSQEARAQNLDEEKAVRQRIDYAEKKILANALIAQRLANIDISEEDMFNYYRIHRNNFQSKLMEYDIQRILCEDEATAKILLKRLQEDYDFNVAVREHSLEYPAANLGRMGFVAPAGEDSLFWSAARKLRQNEPGIAEIRGNIYILRHTGQREGMQDANFAEYKSEIRQIMLRERQNQAYNDLVRELKMRAQDIYYY